MVQATTMVFTILLAAISLTLVQADSSLDVANFIQGEYTRGRCEVQGLYPHDTMSFDLSGMTRRYSLGETVSERCRNCTCTPTGMHCRGHQCRHAYDFSQEEWCLQWSEDGCCCERMGCQLDGVDYDLGDMMPYGDGNTCLTCPCFIGWSKSQCLMQQCNTAELTCVNREVTYKGCCPEYNCPQGVWCDTIPDPYPDTPQHELLNWYGSLNPIHRGMTQHFHIDDWTTYICSCENGGTAKCEMKSFGGWN